ncbi:MAG: L,D-transpeptidase family protein [Chthoniobacterales bacterium]
MKQDAPLSLHISVARQCLSVKRGRSTLRSFPISTSKFGLGSEPGSFKTPTGRFRVAERFGDGLPIDTAFKSRRLLRATTKMLRADDLVMSRILWLDGLQKGNANSYERFIYIHGTNHEEYLGEPASHGCVRMRKADVAELFALIPVGTIVWITPRVLAAGRQKRLRKALRVRVDPPK